MDTLSYKTRSVSKDEVQKKWYIIDGEGEVVGRIASKIASVLRGKHKPSYTPHSDNGDYVIIINAEKVRFTGNKMDQKEYITFSGYPSGQKRRTAKVMMEKKPIAIMENAGFIDISVTPTFFGKESVDEAVKEIDDQIDLDAFSIDELYKTIFSAKITAHKP